MQALQRTLEFEEELAEKFGGDTRRKDIGGDIEEVDKGENSSQTVSDIRKKYEKKLAANQGSGTEVCIIRQLKIVEKISPERCIDKMLFFC